MGIFDWLGGNDTPEEDREWDDGIAAFDADEYREQLENPEPLDTESPF